MSTVVTFNGSTYVIPATGDTGWGNNVSSYLIAIAAGSLQKTGGSFTLSAETDFGGAFGLKALYYKSRSSNISTTGVVRLNNNSDAISWRNAANSADLPLIVNGSNQLTFNGTPIGGSGIFTANRAVITDGSGNLSVSTVTSTEVGYLSGVTSSIQTQLNAKASSTLTSAHIYVGNVSNVATNVAVTGDIGIDNTGLTSISSGVIVNADVSASAAIAYSKLNLSASIVNADIATAAAIARSKIASGTADHVIINDGTGALSSEANLTVGRGGTGSGTHTAYAVLAGGTTATGALQSIASVGSSGQVLTSNGAAALPTFQNVAGTGTVNSGTAGRLSLYATSTNAVSDTYVQNSQNITLAIATQAARSTGLALTIPNPGNAIASANFLLSEGAQTINGIQTFSASPVLSVGATSAGNLNITINDATANNITEVLSLGHNTTGTPANGIGTEIDLYAETSTTPDSRLSTIGSTWTDVTNATRTSNLYFQTRTNGALSTSGQFTGSNGGAFSAKGTNTNDTATAGNIGEVIESVVGTTTAPATGQQGDLTSISLTGGDWLVSANSLSIMQINTTLNEIGISTTSGNSTTGLVLGSNRLAHNNNTVGTTAIANVPITISNYHMQLTTTTTVYFKFSSQYTSTAPTFTGRITALRIR